MGEWAFVPLCEILETDPMPPKIQNEKGSAILDHPPIICGAIPPLGQSKSQIPKSLKKKFFKLSAGKLCLKCLKLEW